MTKPAVGRRFPARDLDGPELLDFLAARAVPGIEQRDGNRWIRALHDDGRPMVLTVTLGGGSRRVEVRATAPAGGASRIGAFTSRLLGLDSDLDPFRRMALADPILGPLVRKRPGLRIPLLPTAFESAVRAVVGQLISVAAARTVLGRLVDRFGPVVPDTPWRLFPEPEAFAAGGTDLAAAGLTRTKVRALLALATAGPVLPSSDLLRLPGIGPWTAGYVALRGHGDPDVFLAGDLGVRQALEALGVPSRRHAAVAERWRPWRSLAMRHLWASLADR